jgi:hypothetical protein
VKEQHAVHATTILHPPTSAPAALPVAARRLAALVAAGPVVFLTVATLAGWLTPGYDAVVQPVSALALGPLGWLQTANFFLFGLAVIAAGPALWLGLDGPRPRATTVGAMVLLAVSGLSLIAAGAFPVDPPGAPETASTALHGLAFFGTFLPLPGAYAFAALRLREAPGWRRQALLIAALPSTIFFLFAVYGVLGSESGDPLFPVSGLLQRLLLAVAFGWLTPTGVRLMGQREAD